MRRLPLVPVSFFSIVLGLIGLGNAWRAAHRVWGLPQEIGEAIIGLGLLVWVVLAALYGAKWIFARGVARAEFGDATPFTGLAGVATMLAAVGLLPYAYWLAVAVFAAGALFSFGFGIWRTGILWQGGRPAAATNAALYLPLVAGSFVLAIGLSAFGLADWAQLAFGAGFFSWLAIESVLLHRLYTAEPMAPAARPTLGIQLAPPAVGAVAYLGAFGAGGDPMLVHAFIGYAILQGVLLGRLLPWISKTFAPGLWSFSFGVTALATATITMAGQGGGTAIATLAPAAFGFANVVIGGMGLATIGLLLRGRLLPQPAPALAPAAN